MKTPGTPSFFCASENIQAASTMSDGFMNSDGCSEKAPTATHRSAPFAEWPMKGRMIMMAIMAA